MGNSPVNCLTGKRKEVRNMKNDIKNALKEKEHDVRGYYERDDLKDLVGKSNIELTCKADVVEEVWLGIPKDFLQVILERGWVNDKILNN